MTIIFDWDGTLHRTEKVYGNAFRKAYQYLVEHGLAEPREYQDSEVSKYLGMNPVNMWNTFRPDLDEKTKQFCSNMIGEELVNQMRNGQAELYEGSFETLQYLKDKGHDMVILSNCKSPYQKAYREVFELDRFFSDFYNCADFGFAPKTEIFKTIEREHDGPYVIVGDRYADLEVAKVHNITGIGCRYGYGSEEELKPADHIIDSIKELSQFL